MSVLTAEFNLDVAKKVWGEEIKEDIAINMIADGDSNEKVMRCTGLDYEEIERLRNN